MNGTPWEQPRRSMWICRKTNSQRLWLRNGGASGAVPSMILDSGAFVQGSGRKRSGCRGNRDLEISETDPYPVEYLSERFMQTLMEAHRVTNIPEAGLRSLQRHFRSLADSEGQSEDGESVGE